MEVIGNVLREGENTLKDRYYDTPSSMHSNDCWKSVYSITKQCHSIGYGDIEIYVIQAILYLSVLLFYTNHEISFNTFDNQNIKNRKFTTRHDTKM
mgnify:CR=1 FL=1